MASKKKEFRLLCRVDPAKVEDMQQMADALKELDTQQLAYISGAIQMAKMMSSMKKRSANQPEPNPA